MDILRQGADCIQRNLGAFGLYLVLIVGSRTLALVVDWQMGLLDAPQPQDALSPYALGINLVLLLTGALAQTIVFAKLGAAIDRPLWKLDSIGEAIRRYFPLWLIMNSIGLMLDWMALLMEDHGALPLLLFMVLAIVYIPVGACIMFYRAFSWVELGRIFRPLVREAPKALVVFTFGGLIFFSYYYFLIVIEGQPYLRPLVEIVFAYTDLVIFCSAWLICMTDRQRPEDDIDF